MLHSLLHLVAVGLRAPSPVPSLRQLTLGELGHLIKALPPAHLDDWKAAILEANSERGIAWMAIARENVHIARELNLPELATTAQQVSDCYVGHGSQQ